MKVEYSHWVLMPTQVRVLATPTSPASAVTGVVFVVSPASAAESSSPISSSELTRRWSRLANLP
jgi:hypothetical protein